MSDWTRKLVVELKRDWRRTGLLAVLLVVGVVLAVRQFGGGQPGQAKARDYRPGPAQAKGGGSALVAPGDARRAPAPTGQAAAGPADRTRGPGKVFRFIVDVSSQNVPRRNPFLLNPDAFPPDPAAAPKSRADVQVNAQSADADAEQRRAALEAIVRAEAEKLQLLSILMADPPEGSQAMIGKDIYTVGQTVGPFVLTRIDASSVTLEKDGFEVVLRLSGRAGVRD